MADKKLGGLLASTKRIVIVGVGGIGTWLLAPLLRFLDSEEIEQEIHIWDGDKYDEGNKNRQDFDHEMIGQFKAEAAVGRFNKIYPGLRLYFHNGYVTPGTIQEAVVDGDLIFTCVDNHPCRRLIDEYIAEIKNVCVISCGNEKYDGNVCTTLRKNGKYITPSLIARHPEIGTATEGDRAGLGCEDEIKAGATQLLFTNLTAAVAAINSFYVLWTHGSEIDKKKMKRVPVDTYFDITQAAMSMVE